MCRIVKSFVWRSFAFCKYIHDIGFGWSAVMAWYLFTSKHININAPLWSCNEYTKDRCRYICFQRTGTNNMCTLTTSSRVNISWLLAPALTFGTFSVSYSYVNIITPVAHLFIILKKISFNITTTSYVRQVLNSTTPSRPVSWAIISDKLRDCVRSLLDWSCRAPLLHYADGVLYSEVTVDGACVL